MRPENANPAELATERGLENKTTDLYSSKIPCKWQMVLRALLNGRSFNRFEGERELNDHCLNSTVSELQSRGVTILRHFESVPGYGGISTLVCRYQLAPESRQHAAELLGRVR